MDKVEKREEDKGVQKQSKGFEEKKAEDYPLNSNNMCLRGALKKFLSDHTQNVFQYHYLSLDYIQSNKCTYTNNFNGAIYIVNQYGATL